MEGPARVSLLIMVLGALAAPQAPAQNDLTLSERVDRLERQSSGGGSVADVLMRLQQLEQEVRELRGQVEQQQHEIESFKARQRDQYLDLDRRLQALSNGQGNGPGSRQNDRDNGNRDVDGDGVRGRGESRGPLESGSAAGELGENPPLRPDATPEQDAAQSGQPVADSEARQEAYDAAFNKLRDGDYAAAAEAFLAFLERFPEGPLADNAHYWLGESYYVTGNFDIALNSFQSVLDHFPESAKAPDAMLKLGFCYYELEQWDQARDTLERVRERYPDTSVSRLAQDRLRLMRIDGR